MLVTELLKKIQFRHNQTQLEELDDQSLDDDVSFPWEDIYLTYKSYSYNSTQSLCDPWITY